MICHAQENKNSSFGFITREHLPFIVRLLSLIVSIVV